MKTIIFCLLTIGISSFLYCQSSIVYGTSTNIDVGTGTDVSAGTITVNGTYTGSGTFNNGPLPVELVSFNALIVKDKVELNWATATEVNNYGFEVERSEVSDQRSVISGQLSEWEKIGFVNGHGNSNSPKEYSFTDPSVTSGSYAYRLKQLDNDGTFNYSSNVEVTIGQIPNDYSLNQNYPNPFNPETIISYQLPVSGNTSLKVFDMLGSEVATLVNEVQEAGTYDVSFNGKDLTSGIYFFRLQSGDFIKINKMTLMK
jgi:hypothetical protein